MAAQNGQIGVVAFQLLVAVAVDHRQVVVVVLLADEASGILAEGPDLVLEGPGPAQKELAFSNVRPTLPDAVAGDITAAMPYRAMINIINYNGNRACCQLIFCNFFKKLYCPSFSASSRPISTPMIINFIQAMDEVVPGFAAAETLLYSPELKFYSNRVKMDEKFCTNIQGLHCLGDSSGGFRSDVVREAGLEPARP